VTLDLTSDTVPMMVSSWTTRSEDRDFRDEHWQSAPVNSENGRYRIELNGSSDQYQALFAEAVFDCHGMPYYLSTNVRIIAPN
jgi:hypothetical protein